MHNTTLEECYLFVAIWESIRKISVIFVFVLEDRRRDAKSAFIRVKN